MDVRSARDIAPVVEHAGTVPVWWLIEPRELHQATKGGFLELVSEWEVAGGGLVDAHEHPTHEFYYIISGRGIMKIADEEREVGQRHYFDDQGHARLLGRARLQQQRRSLERTALLGRLS